MRPILNAIGVTVLNGINVDVVDVILQITFVANDVFIESTLPNTALASQGSTRGKRFVHRNDPFRRR